MSKLTKEKILYTISEDSEKSWEEWKNIIEQRIAKLSIEEQKTVKVQESYGYDSGTGFYVVFNHVETDKEYEERCNRNKLLDAVKLEEQKQLYLKLKAIFENGKH